MNHTINAFASDSVADEKATTSERVRLVLNWGDAATPSRRQPTYSAEEPHLTLRLTQILKNEDSRSSLQKKGEEARADVPLPSCVFLWTPQQRLRVRPGLSCCTRSLPRSPLQRDDGPEPMDGLEMLPSCSEAFAIYPPSLGGGCCTLCCRFISW